MSFAATFNVNVIFDNPTAFANFAAAFDELYNNFFSGGATAARKQPASFASPPSAVPAASNYAPNVPDHGAVPEPFGAREEAASGKAAADASGATAETPDTPKRRRRTKAEMEAARAAEAAKDAPPAELPKPHGGSNTGTTAPLAELPPPLPTAGEINMPEGEITREHVAELFSRVMMLEPDPSAEISTSVLAPLNLSRVRDATPEQYRALCEGFVRIARSRGK